MAHPASKNSSPDPTTGKSLLRSATAISAILALLAQPVRAQDLNDPQRLEDLIPDAAVLDPEGWAAQGVSPQETAESETSPPLDPSSPLAEMPLVTIPWPDEIDIPAIAQVEPEEPIEFVTFEAEIPPIPAGSEERISDELALVFPSETSLFPERDEFLDRFKAMSAIVELDDSDNIARLAAQARTDEELLQRLLRVYGYYDAQLIRSVGAVDESTEVDLDRPAVRIDILPGVRYKVGAIDLGELAKAQQDFDLLRASFEVFPGDPISLDTIETEQFDLDEALGENGYPFAAIADPELLIDHDREEGDLTMAVTPGGKYNLGKVTSNLPEFLSGKHLSRIARWDEGEMYRRSDELDLRRAILATGLVGSVQLNPIEVAAPQGDQPGVVDIEAQLTKAPLRTLAGRIGYGTEEGFKLEGSWEHRNLFPPEGSLRLRGIAGTQEQLAGVTFRKNNFKDRDQILTIDAFASTIDYEAYDARTASLIGTFERVSTLLFQKDFSWSVGLELVATQESERDANGQTLARETFFVAALPTFAQLDGSDDLLDPTKGWRLSARLSPEVSDNDGVQSFYLRSQVDASYYQQIGENVVLAGRARVASIPGAPLDAIAPSRRLYAGGGGSVRGYGYRQIGPLNDTGDPTGGRSLVELSAEARIKTGLFDGALGIVPFIDAGSVALDQTPDFRSIKLGAGIGARYHTGFGPLRLDVAFPLNPGPNDSWVAVYVALGQAF